MTACDEVCCLLINAFICNFAAEMSCVNDDDKKLLDYYYIFFCYKNSCGSPLTIACQEVRRQHTTSASIKQQGKTSLPSSQALRARRAGAAEGRASTEAVHFQLCFSLSSKQLSSLPPAPRCLKAIRLLTRIYWIFVFPWFSQGCNSAAGNQNSASVLGMFS